jgi:hypothetical protein
MAALEQRDAQSNLKLLNAPTQRRLRDGAVIRGTSEMTLFGQGTQKAELLEARQDNHRKQ